jgi:hypothetical protein
MTTQDDFERAYCCLQDALATLDALELHLAGAHLSQAIAEMERSRPASGVDFHALRERCSLKRASGI